MNKLYTSEFADIKGNVWRADIVLRNAPDSVTVSDFYFDADAAEVEWPETELYKPLLGAACTLRVVSPGDRTFIDMYAAEPGDVSLRLYRNNLLYWSGTLDPEFYEEPYDTASGYEVSLTFSDFGALDRLTFDLPQEGISTIEEILKAAFAAASLEGDIIEAHGLKPSTGGGLTLGDLSVRNANFYDEDDQGSSWRDVVEGVLQPLGLRMVQLPGGSVKVFDLYSQRAQQPRQISWEGTGHVLGTGSVYNDISVTFSPYGDSLAIEMSVNGDNLSPAEGATKEVVYFKNSDTNTYQSFLLQYCLNHSGSTPVILDHTKAAFYRTRKYYSGEDGEGIIGKVCAPFGAQQTLFGGVPWAFHTDSAGKLDNIKALFDAGSCSIIAGAGHDDDMLRVTLEALLDSRVNPFESADKANEEGDYKRQEKGWNIVFIPACIYIEGEDGSTWRWVNNDVRIYGNLPIPDGILFDKPLLGSWKEGNPLWGECWLVYYQWSNRVEKSPCSGWMTNRQCIGIYTSVPEHWQKRGDGEFLPMPPVSGTLHVEIGSGVGIFSYDDNVRDTLDRNGENFEVPRWLMYRKVGVEITDGFGHVKEAEDLTQTVAINPKARSPLDIDTICGSVGGTLQTARGVLRLDGAPLTTLSRGSLTDTPERLLIAAVASQYDCRHTVLSGETSAASIDLAAVFTEAAQPAERRFAMLSCRYKVCDACADCKFIELSEQKYTLV